MMNKRYLRRTDYILIAATAAIIIMSLVIIGSATHINTPSEERYWFVQRQGIFALVNVAMAAFLMNFDYKVLQGYGNKLYVFNLILLVAVMLVGVLEAHHDHLDCDDARRQDRPPQYDT